MREFFRPNYNTPIGATAPGEPHGDTALTDTFVWIAMSGGGTRAAALGWAVLGELGAIDLRVTDAHGPRRSNVADEIDHISGISGGSFAAAAWALSRTRRDETAWFRKKFIQKNVQRSLLGSVLFPPWQPVRLTSREYDRINAAAELYDRKVFRGATFADLPARPRVHIHATHLALGDRFTFSRSSFERIGSDLDSYPIGYACAASSAFPMMLSPLTLRNHGPKLTPDELWESDPEYRRSVRDARQQIEQDLRRIGREYFNDKARNPYVHLADGGLVDNQGLQAVLDEFEGTGIVQQRMNNPAVPLKRLMIVNVNAGAGSVDRSGSSPRSPSLRSVMKSAMVTSMDVLSAKRWMRIQAQCRMLWAVLGDGDSGLAYQGMEEPYTVEIAFRNLEDRQLRRQCQALPTSFALSRRQLARIDEAAKELVAGDPHLIRLRQPIADGSAPTSLTS